MNGLVSDYYNLTGQKNINIDNITLTGKFQGSNAQYFTGLIGNIQTQINASNSSTVIYYTISGQISNVINTIVNNYNNQNTINNTIYGFRSERTDMVTDWKTGSKDPVLPKIQLPRHYVLFPALRAPPNCPPRPSRKR